MMARWIVRFFVFFLMCPVLVLSQNLVKNPNFESAKKGNTLSDLQNPAFSNWSKSVNTAKGNLSWNFPLKGGPHSSSQPVDGNRWNGNHPGLYLSAPNNYREFLHGELAQPLEIGRQYKVSFYVRLAERSNSALRDIGILFSNESIGKNKNTQLKNFNDLKYGDNHNFAEIRHWRYFKNKSAWTQVSTTITAKGNEKYFTLGNFRDDRRSEPLPVDGSVDGAYYYIDRIVVNELHRDYVYNGTRPKKNHPLEDVLFANGSYVLDEGAKSELDLLYNELKKDASIYLSVRAYADAKGSERKREKLSSKRARSVARYLVTLGLPVDRIRWLDDEVEANFADYAAKETEKKKQRAEFVISNEAFKSRSSMAETLFDDDN